MIAAIPAVIVLAVSAFGWSDHSSLLAQKSRIHHSNHGISSSRHQNVLRSSSLSEAQDVRQDHQQQQHPHSKLWSITLENSKCYVNPSIELAVRPPAEGGTGIVAVVDVPADTVVMCLPLDEVGMVDAASILDSYNEEEGRDEVLTLLKEMWNRKELATSEGNSEDGKRLAIFAGIIAHLQLTRYKDMKSNTSGEGVSSYALNQSRRLALFLDAMPLLPLLPQRDDNINSRTHPFPTHYLYWTDDEIEILLRGTIGQTKAREVRAGIGLVVREWSSSFLEEHFNNGDITQTEILNAIFSAFTAVLSRSFGDSAGRDLNGKGRMLVPLVDMLNHDGEDPNVRWTWHVGGDDENGIEDGKGDIVVTTLSEVKKGKELFKCYGWRPSWDVASSYGFVPRLSSQRWECSAIPLFPAELDLAPDSIATPNQKANHETTLDLLLESNYAPLLKSVVEAVNELKDRQAIDYAIEKNETTNKENIDRPKQLDRLQVVSLFRPPPKSTAKKYPFLRRQPCVVIGTKIQISLSDENDPFHRDAVESVLPAFRAAASAISQLRINHQRFGNANTSQIVASQMTMAAGDSDWDVPARKLIKEGISDRIQNLVDDGTNAKAWLAKQNDATGMTDQNGEHGRFRADMASDVREAELKVLRALLKELLNGKR